MKNKIEDMLVTVFMAIVLLVLLAMCIIRWCGYSYGYLVIPVIVAMPFIVADIYCIWHLEDKGR